MLFNKCVPVEVRKNVFARIFNYFLRISAFIGIHQKIRLQQDLMIHALYICICMMMLNQPSDSFYLLLLNRQFSKNASTSGALSFSCILPFALPYFSRHNGHAISCTTAVNSRISCVSSSNPSFSPIVFANDQTLRK